MPKVVVDASSWLSVILKEVGSEDIIELVKSSKWSAPEWILIEAANVVSKKADLTVRERMDIIRQVRDDPFDRVPLDVWFEEAASLAIKYHKLSFYDAAYIATAKKLNAPILTEDPEIKKVMGEEGVVSLL